MRFLVAGGSGFLGSHLIAQLRGEGHEVTQLVRRAPGGRDQSQWQPADGVLDPDVVAAADVVVNVAGLAHRRQPALASGRRELRESRVDHDPACWPRRSPTTGGSTAVPGRQRQSPTTATTATEPVTEESESRGDALLTRVTKEWQAATEPAAAAGARVCILRTAPVMDRCRPPLKQLQAALQARPRRTAGRRSAVLPDGQPARLDRRGRHLAGDEEARRAVQHLLPGDADQRRVHRALAGWWAAPAFLVAPKRLLADRPAAMPRRSCSARCNVRPAGAADRGYEFPDRDVTSVLASGLA